MKFIVQGMLCNLPVLPRERCRPVELEIDLSEPALFRKSVQDVILTLLFDMFVNPSDHHVPTLDGRIDLFVC